MQRIMIFIDGSNLYHGMKDILGQVTIDYQSLISMLVKNRNLIRTYYYTPVINRSEAEEQYRSQQRFLSYLADIPYFEVKFGILIRQGEVLVEKSIDVKLAVDMVKYAAMDQYDIAILVSGDGDYTPAVEAVKEMGKQVECTFFSQETSSQLKQIVDIFIDLDKETLTNCIIYKENNQKF